MSKKLVIERNHWIDSTEGQNAVNIMLQVCDRKFSNDKIINHLHTALILAFKAGSRAAVKVFTLESNN